jgi:hypothetical protein
MSPELLKVMERAKDPKFVFLSLAHLIDEAALTRAFRRIRKDAAVGVDGLNKELYGQELERHVRDLHQRLRTMRWRHQPILRVHIPKEKGKSRPIGMSLVEDKIRAGSPARDPRCIVRAPSLNVGPTADASATRREAGVSLLAVPATGSGSRRARVGNHHQQVDLDSRLDWITVRASPKHPRGHRRGAPSGALDRRAAED